MNYLLLMYHTDTYWEERTDKRDAQEEEAFASFCAWMREQGITWTSQALDAPSPSHVRRFNVNEMTSQMLPELSEVISGYFELSIPNDEILEAVLDRCPHIDSTRLELRKIAG